ncbi:non-ribosomal peptide synthetase [[Clostridium] polysaccharolyticum]|uniref:Amino acid adenylation domain-containing protein n=1 Tax=[Clostridium] polysaccharolyticum TaxID=29364 RepID=A0A1I0C404_9FIRM|nr:non-ribosomal peptide synthetase [[Clostridium] polysaccharolyticum]SET14164.1 amino acid adenylation domain-containing protein [[Clostridium] polysaccharolyticum]
MNKLEICGQLIYRVSEESVTLENTMLACYAVLLSRMYQKNQVRIHVKKGDKACNVNFEVEEDTTIKELICQMKLETLCDKKQCADGFFHYIKSEVAEGMEKEDNPVCGWHLQCTERQNVIEMQFLCNGFCDTYYRLMCGRMDKLVAQFTYDANMKVKDLDWKAREEALLLNEFTKITRNEIDDVTFHELFERQAASHPERIAVQCGAESITFQELNERANQVAHYICEMLSGSQSFIGVFMERSIAFITAILGIIKSGNGYVPIDPDTLNPGHNGVFPTKRLKFMLDDIQMEMIVTNDKYEAYLPAGSQLMLNVDKDILSCYPKENLDFPIHKGNIIYGIYTSGSTGYPKLSIVEHKSVINLYQNLVKYTYPCLDGVEVPVVSQNAPFGFDASVQELVGLLHGYCVAIIPEAVRNSVHKMLQYLKDKKVNVFDCTPSQMDLLLEQHILDTCRDNLKLVLLGGEAIPAKMWNVLREEKEIQIFNVYGPTECTVDTTFYKINGCEYDYPVLGRPIDNMQIFILDENFKEVPIGCEGEIFIAGEGVSRGYFNRPELNKKSFLADAPVQFEGRYLYRSGDKGIYLCDGTIQYMGRLDSQVKIRSHRIELNEITTILNQHQNIKDSLVVLDKSTGYEKIIAYIRWKEAKEFDIEELSPYLAQYLPSYMIPNHYMEIYKWPLTANNKIDRARLPLPGKIRKEKMENGNAPKDELLKGITEIVCRILKVDNIQPNENFMLLGGDSLRVMTLLAEILSSYGVEVDFEDFFTNPTISYLYKKVKEGGEV